MEGKEIHFYSHMINEPDIIIDWESTEEAISRNEPVIHTMQMGLLSGELWQFGYRIFVHDFTGDYEIKLGDDNKRTFRTIREAHNLFKMWQAGEFAKTLEQILGKES